MTGSASRVAALGLLALLVPYAVLALPNHPDAATPAILKILPLELPIIAGALILASAQRWLLFAARIVVALLQRDVTDSKRALELEPHRACLTLR